ncbi:flagellar biosynthesis anti-sigma factor FlgM [Bdellovibrio bacteriovorus]|uniref:Negative regulator of flagellin synthesis n=1 Tax=Bdellovibrio bacteriovorus TaxID=959 RepID=A0A150WIE9_BDEBC|nr:flagellar biosynthesis anti-sigma factor FlgM [Bdellovibrio bacteriovorus]KYG63269.1 flagellar biosynthesis anti-sigma factor FlgM [Bdellovibrio bacteriovorus]KYG69382.1 flagellar biosynthesis anti-sigma factor FlgM [Bdellovibrio bacteriovorus]
MKITHNKVGQNLNLTDSSRSNKADAIKNNSAGAPTAKADALTASTLGESSRVELSPRAQEAKRIKELAMSAPDVDEAKVAKFRKLIDDGKYNVDAKAIADKMVDEHLDF